jgi:hypothetical protein
VVSNSQLEDQLEADTTEGEAGGQVDRWTAGHNGATGVQAGQELECYQVGLQELQHHAELKGQLSALFLEMLLSYRKETLSLWLEMKNVLLEPRTRIYIDHVRPGGEMHAAVRYPSLLVNKHLFLWQALPIYPKNKESKELYAGVESSMVLNVWTRSKTVEAGTEVCLATSGGMMAKTNQDDCKFSSTVLVSFPAGEPFQTICQENSEGSADQPEGLQREVTFGNALSPQTMTSSLSWKRSQSRFCTGRLGLHMIRNIYEATFQFHTG